MKSRGALTFGGFASIATAAGAWLSGADAHTVPAGLPGAPEWRVSVAAVAPRTPAPDPGRASPAHVRAFFAGLTLGQRTLLARRDPGVVGNLDGVPYRLRYTANLRALGPHAPRPAGRLLGYDPRGDGRAVEVFGDLDRARDIAVLVPGAGWDLSKLLSDTTSADSPVIAARALRAEMHRLEPASSTAVVVWLGYDAPEGIDREAMRSGRAIAGGRPLARFLAGLRYGDQDSRHVSLIGHSYGAVVAGRAVAARARVADFVALAAPGIDVSSAAGLHAAGGTRVWAARDARDPIRFTPFVRFAGLGHGTDPTEPTFGASVFRTGSARGHAGYFARGSESLTNLARIALGRTREVTLR